MIEDYLQSNDSNVIIADIHHPPSKLPPTPLPSSASPPPPPASPSSPPFSPLTVKSLDVHKTAPTGVKSLLDLPMPPGFVPPVSSPSPPPTTLSSEPDAPFRIETLVTCRASQHVSASVES